MTPTAGARNANVGGGPAGEMPVAEAAQVIWQGRPNEPRGAMGLMLERGQLSAGDLEWAAAKHFNPRVKAAARTLLRTVDSSPATRLPAEAGPTPGLARPGGPAVRRGSTHLESQEFDSLAYM